MPKIEPEVHGEIQDAVKEVSELNVTWFIFRAHFLPSDLPIDAPAAADYESDGGEAPVICGEPGVVDPRYDSAIVTEHYIAEVLRKFASPRLLYLTVREKGDGSDGAEGRPHYHTVFCSAAESKTIRNYIKKYWKGQGSYMLKQGKPDLIPEQFNYLCKGTGTGSDDGPNVIDRHPDLCDDVLHEIHCLYWRNNDKFKAASKKRKATSISEQCFELCKHLTPPIKRRDIALIIRDYYGKRLLHWNPDYVRKLVYQTQMYLEPISSNANQLMLDYIVGLPFRPE